MSAIPEYGYTPPSKYTERLVSLTDSFYVEKAVADTHFSPAPRIVLLSEIKDVYVQQAVITREVLQALLGYEGTYIRFSERYNRQLVHDRIAGPDFKVAKHLDVSLKAITKKLFKYGKHYLGLKLFAQVYDAPVFGRVNQSLCHEINKYLEQFEKLVLSFEESFHYNSAFTLNQMDNDISKFCADNLLHLYHIAVAIHTDTETRNPAFDRATSSLQFSGEALRTANFGDFMDYIRDDLLHAGQIELSTDTNKFDVCKGGPVLRIVAQRVNKSMGDAVSFQFLSLLFDDISKPYVSLLNTWLSSGDIEDPFLEFFIKQNELPTNIFYLSVEKYWDELYVIKIDGIMDQFESRELQTQVLATGKYLNIFRQCTGSSSALQLSDSLPLPIESLYSQDLTAKVKQFYDRANNLLLRLLFEGYSFRSLVLYLHQTFLLQDSSSIDNFLAELFPELSRNKHHTATIKPIKAYNDLFLKEKLFEVVDLNDSHKSSQLDIMEVLQVCEKFTVDSNSFYEMAEEIINIRSFDVINDIQSDANPQSAMKRIVSQSLERRQASSSSEGNTTQNDSIDNYTIAGVNIDLQFPFPLSLIISENFVFEYQLLFKLQMILKFASKYTDNSWKDINFLTVWKHGGFLAPVRKLILRCRVLNVRMKSLLNELQNYLNFSIIDTNFDELSTFLGKFEKTVRNYKQKNEDTTLNSSQILLRHIGKTNDIFTEKIMASTNTKAQMDNNGDVTELTNKIGTYLNNTLRDSLVTNSQLLSCLRSVLTGVIQYNNMVTRLKKTLITMDQELLIAYKRDFPDKFSKIDFSESLVHSRIAGLSEVLTTHWTHFNNSLQGLNGALTVAAAENAIFSELSDKLQAI